MYKRMYYTQCLQKHLYNQHIYEQTFNMNTQNKINMALTHVC